MYALPPPNWPRDATGPSQAWQTNLPTDWNCRKRSDRQDGSPRSEAIPALLSADHPRPRPNDFRAPGCSEGKFQGAQHQRVFASSSVASCRP